MTCSNDAALAAPAAVTNPPTTINQTKEEAFHQTIDRKTTPKQYDNQSTLQMPTANLLKQLSLQKVIFSLLVGPISTSSELLLHRREGQFSIASEFCVFMRERKRENLFWELIWWSEHRE
jgi:hypothetical protein